MPGLRYEESGQVTQLRRAAAARDAAAKENRRKAGPVKGGKSKRTCLKRFDGFEALTIATSAEQMAVINMAWAASTRKKYGSFINHFVRFCDRKGVPAEDRFPTSHNLLLDYVVDMTGELGSKAVGTRVTALKNVHAKAGLAWEGDTRQMQLAKKGVANMAPDTTVDKRPPVTQWRMEVLEDGLDMRDGRDVAVSFTAKASRAAMLRMGEILPASKKLEAFDSALLPTAKDIGEEFSTNGSRMLNLPWGKTSLAAGAKVPLCTQASKAINTTRIWELHRVVNEVEGDAPLCSYMEGDQRKLLSRADFMRRCNEVWAEKGLEPLTGHSFRIGGATHYLVNGVQPNVVKAMGRWKSDAFEAYWRDLEALAAIHIELMPLREELGKVKM
ncbi:hypothetical protein CYLTODRAFT_426868 [Cylindrobasidium torrendii FP15055 ss-10]|uniref:DNA breaking-rejoining enzyme n=1 Tax=Cylindrobasidium torrendii FP15055 ss-10 TaxID=1314674 RepID=A0A0D7AYZ8_9AGAR|nr:hypothetical protein CYLTODRAFT_426868 [Cylindrobasidium torrendii FP15055 ss-10]